MADPEFSLYLPQGAHEVAPGVFRPGPAPSLDLDAACTCGHTQRWHACKVGDKEFGRCQACNSCEAFTAQDDRHRA